MHLHMRLWEKLTFCYWQNQWFIPLLYFVSIFNLYFYFEKYMPIVAVNIVVNKARVIFCEWVIRRSKTIWRFLRIFPSVVFEYGFERRTCTCGISPLQYPVYKNKMIRVVQKLSVISDPKVQWTYGHCSDSR